MSGRVQCEVAIGILIWEEENQLDATQGFVEHVICSTCFRHFYAHYQELATILLIWHVASNSWSLVVGRSGTGQQAMRPGWGMLFSIPYLALIACCPAPDLPK